MCASRRTHTRLRMRQRVVYPRGGVDHNTASCARPHNNLVETTHVAWHMRGVRCFIFPHWFIGQCEKIKVERFAVSDRATEYASQCVDSCRTRVCARSSNEPCTPERVGDSVSDATNQPCTMRPYVIADQKLNARISTTHRN